MKNFGCIGDNGFDLDIDDIVVLIGANNVGKSTILDAYEAFAGTGSPLPLNSFHNKKPEIPVSISAVFVDVTDDDQATLGTGWLHDDERYGACIRVKWQWTKPDAKGQKYSWDHDKSEWTEGGMGGWDTLLASRTPVPLRVRPTDNADTTEAQVRDILTSAVKAAIKADQGKIADIAALFENITDELTKEIEDQFKEIVTSISERMASIFPDHTIDLTPDIGKLEPEKVIGGGSYISVGTPGQATLPLSKQGAGLRRAFLWSALGALADAGKAKVGRKTIDADQQRILLVEEPESFLHPPMIRAAREALYALAEVNEWQVLISTHSPIFIDVSKPHTTIVRVSRDADDTRLFATDEAQFSPEDRENLQMIRACHPTVAEFFFANHVFLVEGETEHSVFSVLLSESVDPHVSEVAVVNCLGKGNLPLFQKILNRFGTAYTVVHDSDVPHYRTKKGKLKPNGMWTMNNRIYEALQERKASLPKSEAVVHIPDFEHVYFETAPKKDKPHHALRQLHDDKDIRAALEASVEQLLSGTHPSRWASDTEFIKLVEAWIESADLEDPDLWEIKKPTENDES